MAVLVPLSRRQIVAHAMRIIAWPGLLKADLVAAVNATDDWVEANAATYNAALPVPFRTTTTSVQKAALLAFICFRRAGFLSVEGD